MRTAILVALVALFVAVESKSYYYTQKPPRPSSDCKGYSKSYLLNGICKILYKKYGHHYVWKYGTYHVYRLDCTCFVQCNWWYSYIMPCAPGTVWNQRLKTCVHGKKVHGICYSKFYHHKGHYGYVKYHKRYPKDCKGYSKYDKFCSYQNKHYGKKHGYKYKFQQYFEYRKDCSCFYQCDKSGRTFIMPCAYGTVWDQSKLTCVRPCPHTCKGRYNPVHILLAYCPKYYYKLG